MTLLDLAFYFLTVGGVLVLVWAVAVWPELQRREDDE
jgi:hypothetical protein